MQGTVLHHTILTMGPAQAMFIAFIDARREREGERVREKDWRGKGRIKSM